MVLIKKIASLSLKWKLSLALVGLSLGIVSLYVILAINTFESDKIAYVFETRQSQLESLANTISLKLERGLSDAQLVLSGYDLKEKRLNSVAQKLFETQKSLLSISVKQSGEKLPFVEIKKANSPDLTMVIDIPTNAHFFARSFGANQFLVAGRDNTKSQDLIQARIEIPEALVNKGDKWLLLLIENGKVVSSSAPRTIPQFLLDELSLDRAEKTTIRRLDGEDFLISTQSIAGTELKIISFDTASSALGAIRILFNRSLVFIVFSVFLTVLLSLALSNGLTQKLHNLTETAIEIGQGDFSHKSMISADDEVGILQKAFSRMSLEIQKLLEETKQKAIIDLELQTARLVQERLFPDPTSISYGDYNLSGLYATSTTLGGDWWFYYKRGDNLYIVIADATGHGTPAALITSASRALFSKLKQEDLTLTEIAKAWDCAIAESGGRKVFMTALLLKINLSSGSGRFLNASHEAPILIRQDHSHEFLDVPPGPTLGEQKDGWREIDFSLKDGDRLLLFTDGLWAIENKEKKALSEHRFAKKLSSLSALHPTNEGLMHAANAYIQGHRQGEHYPDDVTMVLIDRKTLQKS
jgi:sigma-B regulation protein RsbU (phosphoserine phosphatase)